MFPKTICISIAEFPGKTGGVMHNAAYRELGLDYVYVPLKVTAENLENAVKGVRALGIRGCGVSMPHKIPIIQYLDEIDEKARKIGAVNTVVNENGKLIGYNTDYHGILSGLREVYSPQGKKAVVIGAGGAARAVVLALKDLGAKEITVLNRTESKARDLAREFNVKFLAWDDLKNISGNLLVNATPVGMKQIETKSLVEKDVLRKFEAVVDVVTNPLETDLIKTGRELGLVSVPGHRMALLQAAKQFELYTEQKAPLDVMEKSLLSLMSG